MTDTDASGGNRRRGGGDPADPVVVAEAWDEGLAPQRTQLAWGRTGLAMAVAIAVLARRAWDLGGAFEVAAVIFVGLGGLVWLVGMRESRDPRLPMAPPGLTGVRGYGLVTVGTLLLAVGATVLGIQFHS